MKVQPKNADSFVRRPFAGVRVILVYGPDPGLVRERARHAGLSAVSDLNDPFNVVELKPDQLAQDPARLFDEMAALSLMGGRRLIRVRDADDGLTSTLSKVLAAPPPGDSLVVIEAGDLGKSSKLRGLVEEGPDVAAAVACYVESEEELAGTIGRILGEHGLQIDPDARTWLAEHLVGDRGVARGEIDKLAIYMRGETRIGLDHVRAVIGDSGAMEVDGPGLAAADGDLTEVDRALRRLFADGVTTVAILRSTQRHFQRLHLAVAAVARGQTPQQAVKALRPPIFFKLEARVTAQARRWTLPLLGQALERLVEAEIACKRTGIPDETFCARAHFQLAQLARRG